MDTHALAGLMVSTVVAALTQAELEIKHERIPDMVAKRRAAGKCLGGQRSTFIDSRIRATVRLLEAGS